MLKCKLRDNCSQPAYTVVHCSFAVKTIAKRWAPGSYMEPLFVRRIQHEVDIYNHIGQLLPAPSHTHATCCHSSTSKKWNKTLQVAKFYVYSPITDT